MKSSECRVSRFIVFDSDFIIDFLKGNANAVEKYKSYIQDNDVICTTVISISEVARGVNTRRWGQERIENLENFLNHLHIIEYTKNDAYVVVKYLNALDNLGTPVGFNDTIIAVLTLNIDGILFTKNINHFALFQNLQVEGY